MTINFVFSISYLASVYTLIYKQILNIAAGIFSQKSLKWNLHFFSQINQSINI